MINSLFNKFISIGSQHATNLYDIRRIKSLNVLYLVSIASALIYSVIFISLNSRVLGAVIISSILFVAFCILGIYANKSNKLLLSQHMLCFSLTFICFYNTFMYIGVQTYNHFYFLLFSIVPILIWNKKQLLSILFYFTINEFCFIYTEFFWTPGDTLIKIPELAGLIISIFTVWITFSSLITVLWIFISLIQENEKKLLEQKNNWILY